MKTSSVAVLAAISLLFVVCPRQAQGMPTIASSSSSGSRTVSWEENARNFENHCSVPKPQVQFIRDDYIPSAVLVNRCSGGAGCCKDGEQLVVNTEEVVHFELKVEDDDRPVYHSEKNHLSCKCN